MKFAGRTILLYPIFVVVLSAVILMSEPGIPWWGIGLVEYHIVSCQTLHRFGWMFLLVPLFALAFTMIHCFRYRGIFRWMFILLSLGHLGIILFFAVNMFMMAFAKR